MENISVEGNAVAGTTKHAFGVYEEKRAYKDSRVGWLTLSCIDTLHTGNERLTAVNKQLIDKCKNQRTLVVAYKQALITCSRMPDTIKE